MQIYIYSNINNNITKQYSSVNDLSTAAQRSKYINYDLLKEFHQHWKI